MMNQTPPLKTAISAAKLAANRANSQKSTGPKTAAGKAASSKNALKHGFCSRTVVMPDENSDLFDNRFDAWSPELNPFASEAASYIVAQLVRKSIRLDRCHLVHDSTVAELARSALMARDAGRALLVEELSRLFPHNADVAVRRLREFPEGCDYLIKEWALVDPCLVDPPLWDSQDEGNCSMLLGRLRIVRLQAPSPFVLPTQELVEHREVSTKLEENKKPDRLDWTKKYKTEEAHDHDRERVLDLSLAAIRSKAEVVKLIAAQVANLEARKAELMERDRIEASEATLRARFDGSDRGKLLHRHETDIERGFFRGLKELREMSRWMMQMGSLEEDTSDRSWVGTRPEPSEPARNEARPGVVGPGLKGWEPVEVKGYSEVNVSITPKMGPKRKQ